VLKVVFVLVLLLVITRIVQRRLETELLPHTRIEPSTHNLLFQTAGGAIG
jgi:small-conductance mechanosensitive channel